MKGECEHIYGFLPCSNTILGHLFLILAYEFFIFHGESYVAAGGQRIFKMLGPGAFGACAFQLIGSLPEALVLLATGLLNKEEGAEEYVLIAVGLVAGSSIFLLTLLWGTCVLLSAQRFSDSPENTNIFLSLWPRYGVETDSQTCSTARIMLVSVIPFAIIQIPRLLRSSSRVFVIVALVVSTLLLLSYFLYQMFWPWIQKRQLLYLKHGNLVSDILKRVQNHANRALFTTDDGAPNLSIIKSIFEQIDGNGDNHLTAAELSGFQWSLLRQDGVLDISAIKRTIEELERNGGDQSINEDEFVTNFSVLLDPTHTNQETEEVIDYQKKWEETDDLVEDRIVDKSVVAWIKAISLVIIGISMLGVIAEPLIHSVQDLSKAAKLPSFFIAFIFIPLATNARVAASAISEARRKKESITSMALSEIYGAVLMNNLLGLSVLLSLVHFRGLTWSFSFEMLMVLMVTGVVGCAAGFTRVLPVWISIFAYVLYPLSLFLVNTFGDFEWKS